MNSILASIEKQLDQLTRDEQLQLIELLAQRLRGANGSQAWADDIAAMAADPQIQAELRAIEREFSGTEMDGLEKY